MSSSSCFQLSSSHENIKTLTKTSRINLFILIFHFFAKIATLQVLIRFIESFCLSSYSKFNRVSVRFHKMKELCCILVMVEIGLLAVCFYPFSTKLMTGVVSRFETFYSLFVFASFTFLFQRR